MQAEVIRFSPYKAQATKVTYEFKADGVCCPLLTLQFVLSSEVNRIGKELSINEEIRAREVRVVSDTNEQLGIMNTREALRLAEEKNLDLVEVAPNGKPPVCRIMNYGKFKYEQQKRDKEAKKKQKVFQIKEVKLRPNIDEHDFFVKLKNAQRFLADGNKVKVTIMFRGREMSHPELGQEVLDRFAHELGDTIACEKAPKIEGRNMTMIVAPKA